MDKIALTELYSNEGHSMDIKPILEKINELVEAVNKINRGIRA